MKDQWVREACTGGETVLLSVCELKEQTHQLCSGRGRGVSLHILV